MEAVIMNVMEAAALVGGSAAVAVDGLAVRCRVVDARLVWGRWQLQVTPLAGSGARWVEVSRVSDFLPAAGAVAVEVTR